MMLRRTGRVGAILTLSVPIQASGMWVDQKAVVKIDVLIEKVEDGKVTLVVAEPVMEDL